MDSSAWLTTERLQLRRFVAADFEWFCGLYGDDAVMRHLGGPRDPAGVKDMFSSRILDYYDQHPGLGIWCTVERETGRLTGLHNLNHIKGETLIQVGFILHEAFWGKGYAGEMASALVEYGFQDLDLDRIVGMTEQANVGAQRVFEKMGFQRRGSRRFDAYASAGALAWFELDRADRPSRRSR